MSDAKSAHGVKIYRQATPGGAFTQIGEVRDIAAPTLSRNEIDVTPHDDDIDAYVLGILRRSPLTFKINYLASDAEHNEAAGLYKHLKDNTKTGYKIDWPDGAEWIFSGFVQSIGRPAAVDGGLEGDVTIRPTGPMKINQTMFGG